MGIDLVSLKYWAKSDIGKKRTQNEDCFYANEKFGLFIIADGMGGHRGGDKASRLAVDSAADFFVNSKPEDTKEALKHAFLYSAEEVYKVGNSVLPLKGMGTTLSAIAIKKQTGYIAHIGDSRIYLIRNNNIRQLTCDHSLVNEHIAAGLLSEIEARSSHLRNIITRAIGHKKKVHPDFFSLPLLNNDLILLCTDGLNGMLLDEDILNVISNNYQTAVDELIKKANNNGGLDNITAMLIKVSF